MSEGMKQGVLSFEEAQAMIEEGLDICGYDIQGFPPVFEHQEYRPAVRLRHPITGDPVTVEV